jgi:hypothetical protein
MIWEVDLARAGTRALTPENTPAALVVMTAGLVVTAVPSHLMVAVVAPEKPPPLK